MSGEAPVYIPLRLALPDGRLGCAHFPNCQRIPDWTIRRREPDGASRDKYFCQPHAEAFARARGFNLEP